MKEIPLTQGQIALVDDEDFDTVNRYKWYAAWTPGIKSFYAVRHSKTINKKRSTILMHRFILGIGPKKEDTREVDHYNHDGTNNTRQNLKITDRRGNAENQRNQSKYGVGVYKTKFGKYQVQIKVNGKRKNIGNYDTTKEAQKAREDYLEKIKETM